MPDAAHSAHSVGFETKNKRENETKKKSRAQSKRERAYSGGTLRTHPEYFPAAQRPVVAARPVVSQYEPFTHDKQTLEAIASW